MGYMLEFVVDLVEERVDLISRTLVLCACFSTEYGSPGIRKSMSASFTIFSHISSDEFPCRTISIQFVVDQTHVF